MKQFVIVGSFDRMSVGDEGVMTRPFSEGLDFLGIWILDDNSTRKMALRYPAHEEGTRLKHVEKLSGMNKDKIQLINFESLESMIIDLRDNTQFIISAYEDNTFKASLSVLFRKHGGQIRFSRGTGEVRNIYKQTEKERKIQMKEASKGKESPLK